MFHDIAAQNPVDSGQESAASQDIRLEVDESALEVHLMLM